MKILNLLFYFVTMGNVLIAFPAAARCAVCVVNGMSGASIAVIIILSVFILLGLANWGFKKFFLDKN